MRGEKSVENLDVLGIVISTFISVVSVDVCFFNLLL